jgi:hypothetical protein
MPLVFDSFPDRTAAERFAAAVKQQFDLGATVYDSQDVSAAIDFSHAVDLSTYQLSAPIVLVERAEYLADSDESASAALEKENAVEQLAEQLGGEYVGT